ncbi:aryl-sulfate sulfotransferase [Streptomycetaceae bacterium NBC_01309]
MTVPAKPGTADEPLFMNATGTHTRWPTLPHSLAYQNNGDLLGMYDWSRDNTPFEPIRYFDEMGFARFSTSYGWSISTDQGYDRGSYQVASATDPTVEQDIEGTADGKRILIGTSEQTTVDLSAHGGPENAKMLQGVVREFDLATRTMLFEWRSLAPGAGQIPLTASYADLATSLDYLHLNSVGYDTDGSILVAATNTGAVYKIDRNDGSLRWVLGGRNPTLAVAGDTPTIGRPQDAHPQADGALSFFDDQSAPGASQAVAYRIDEAAGTATQTGRWGDGEMTDAGSGSGSQPLPNGNHLVTYARQGIVREYAPSGEVLFEMTFAPGTVYRAQRADGARRAKTTLGFCGYWRPDGSYGSEVFTIGGTDVVGYEVWSGLTAWQMTRTAYHPKTGWATKISGQLPLGHAAFQVRAVDAAGQHIGGYSAIGLGDPIMVEYGRLGGPASFLGKPVGARRTLGGLEVQDYVGGSIFILNFYSAATLTAAEMGKYTQVGGPASWLGAPTGQTVTEAGVRRTYFEHGVLWSSSKTPVAAVGPELSAGAWERRVRLGIPVADQAVVGRHRGYQVVKLERAELYYSSGPENEGVRDIYGAIQTTWKQQGGIDGILGMPRTDEIPTRAPGGRYNDFYGGTITWSPSTGAHAVYGAIFTKYRSTGRESGYLGFPTTSEMGTPDGRGRYNKFQNGSVYWTPQTGARAVQGAINTRWGQVGWERGVLGYPLTDEVTTPDGRGRFTHFERGGSIYWTPWTGAHEVYGAIRDTWASLGWERGRLGYPTSGEYTPAAGQRRTNFEGGYILWTAATGRTQVVYTR